MIEARKGTEGDGKDRAARRTMAGRPIVCMEMEEWRRWIGTHTK